MTAVTASHIPETIRLQLRKPKSWQWELSTSKSSPSIILPIIQLYDYKGNLLVEAKDTGHTSRNIWQSSNPTLNENNSQRSRSLMRTRSYTINPSEKRGQRQICNSANFAKDTDPLKGSKSSDVVEKIAIAGNGRRTGDNGFGTNRLAKSKSELYDSKGLLSPSKNGEKRDAASVEGKRRHRRSKSDDLFRRKLRYNSSSAESIKRAEMDGYKNFITPHIPNNKIQTETSTGDGSEKSNDEITTVVTKNRKTKRNGMAQVAEVGTVDNNALHVRLEEVLHNKRYVTRTSSAGTLIIPEEALKDDCHRRRRNRRRRDGVQTMLDSLPENQDATASMRDLKEMTKTRRSAAEKHIRQTSDPTTLLPPEKLAKYAADRSTSSFGETTTGQRKTSSNHHQGLFYSLSDVFPFQNLLSAENRKDFVSYRNYRSLRDQLRNYRDKIGENRDENDNFQYNNANHPDKCPNFRVKTDENDREQVNNDRNKNRNVDSNGGENSERRSRRRERRRGGSRTADKSSSSSRERDRERARERRKGHLIREHSAAQREKQVSGGTSAAAAAHESSRDANDLLKLVRRLSHSYTAPRKPPTDNDDGDNVQQVEENDVKMGANVSRHSAKGLGRRSQSSGSICNGSGSGSIGKGSNRHPEGKICSSLPSYLDDREKNGACNNNHDRKHHEDEDRIPPLGDSAPLHWKFSDTQTICDQGYGSERSPEEEYPPPLTGLDQEALQCHHHLEPHACYPFITPDSTFLVKLNKGSRGLGLSVTGGIGSNGSWPGLIRIKRLFPHQPASSCGLLNVGDLLLEANGITLTGLTNYEALEVLRTAPNNVDLKVCRPPPDVLNCVSPISEVPPPPPRREPPTNLNLPSNAYTTPEDDYYHGEFEITLKKIQGSLGFTLRKEDDSALGHYVRALVREPALTDGRIRAGDKIIAVNDVEICPMSHEQAVQFLRQCPEIVKLRLYRDSAQTPVAALSPSETTPRNSFSRKAHLRQEAVDMLNDLAGRKLIGMNPDVYNRSLSPTSSSPRRLRRQTCPSDASQGEGDYVQAEYSTNPPQDYDYQEQFHEGIIHQIPRPFDEDAFNSLFSMESEDGDRPNRPSSLELYNPNQTPVASRKPRFNFSLAHNAYELNNLDAEVLDAPNLKYNLCNEDVKTSDSEVQEPVSMPHIPVATTSNFSHKHPAYQSAHPQITSEPEQPQPTVNKTDKIDDGTIKRRKNAENKEAPKPNLKTQRIPVKEEYEVLAIELNRGWNSRLGFSLQGAAGVTYVSAVHADSVAARDGRLKPGDRLIKVNDESIEHMTTSEIIDLLRIVRGPVCIVVSRVKSNEDCPNSNAEN